VIAKLARRFTAKVPGRFPFRAVLLVPFVLQVCGITSLVGYLSFRNGQVAVHDLAQQLQQETTRRIEQDVRSFLEPPHQVNQSNAMALRSGYISASQPAKLEQHFWQQLQVFPSITGNGIANVEKELIVAERLHHGQLTLRVSGKATRYNLVTYASGKQGERGQALDIGTDYDPNRRHWFKAPIAARKPIWSEVYPHINGHGLFIAAAQPYYSTTGALEWVIHSTLNLSHISNFLQNQKVGKAGQSFILERSGNLIATSTGEVPFRFTSRQPGQREESRALRLPILQSQNPITQATGQYLLAQFTHLSQIQAPQRLTAVFDRQRYWLHVTPLRDERGLDWLIVVVVPETAFMAVINANTQRNIILCLVSLLTSLLVGVAIVHWITAPIQRLNAVAGQLAEGNLDARITLERQDELGKLAQAFNRMAEQLQQSFLQQRLLNQALSDSQRSLSQILEALPIGVAVVNTRGQCDLLNETGRELLGMSIIPDLQLEQVAATYGLYRAGTNQLYPLRQMPLIRALAGKAMYADDLEIRQNGRTIFLEMRATPIVDRTGEIVCAIATFQNITQRKLAETALRQSEARFRNLTKNVPGVIYQFVLRPDGSSAFTYISPRFQDIYEIEAAAVVRDSQVLWQLIASEDAVAMQRSIAESAQTLSPWKAEYRITTPSGKTKWLQGFSRPELQPDGEIVWDGFVFEISDRKHAEQVVADYNLTLEAEVAERTEALQHANAELERLATRDGLTQVANRRYFDTYLAQEWRRALRESQLLSLILCDADYFKRYNDFYGHQGGDDCLRRIAHALTTVVRRPADLVARYGGEEFVVVLPNTDVDGAVIVAEAIQTAIAALRIPHARSPISTWITLSLGLSCLQPSQEHAPETLVAMADQALYQAKNQGRNRYRIAERA